MGLAKGEHLGIGADLERSRRPVFVMGCHRSGTNLLYDTLLSAGGFAIYRGYLPIHKMLIPKCGDPANRENRQKLLSLWLRSSAFRKSGLDAKNLSEKIMSQCRTGGDFISIVMNEIARQQGVSRWAVYDADNVLYIPRIAAEIPGALFVHIIRDGRDIALSLKKMGGFRPFPWNRSIRGLNETALYWEWMVEKGRSHGRQFPEQYTEVHYEALIQEPRRTLEELGRFLQHDLDYDKIKRSAQGTLSASNSSFREEGLFGTAAPVQRWKQRLSAEEVAEMEGLVGDCLQSLGYTLESKTEQRAHGVRKKILKPLYRGFLNAKVWLKVKTPLGRFANLDPFTDPV
jgi:Sulfotransferase family